MSTPQQVEEAIIAGDLGRVQALVGGNPALVNTAGANNMSPLHHAVLEDKVDIAAWLLAQGADTQSIDTLHGATPLGWAAFYARTDIVKLLLEAGANKMHRNTYGETPLQVAEAGVTGRWEKDSGVDRSNYGAVVALLQ